MGIHYKEEIVIYRTMKYILLLAAILAVTLAQTRGRSGAGSRPKSSVRPKRDWSGEDFWPMAMMYWGNHGGNYGARFRSNYNNMGYGGGNNMGYDNNMGYNQGNMGGNMDYNQGGNYAGGRSRPYSGNSEAPSWNNYGWGAGWRSSYPMWYSGGWWGGNNWSGEMFDFSDRLGVAAPTFSSGRSASASAP